MSGLKFLDSQLQQDRENYDVLWGAESKLNLEDSLQVSLQDTVESIMLPYEQARPLYGDCQMKSVMMQFFRDDFVPMVDNSTAWVGIVHAKDCVEVLSSVFWP